jgi:hypothetical protein
MLRNTVIPRLRLQRDNENCHLQQDGAPPHWVRKFLDKELPHVEGQLNGHHDHQTSPQWTPSLGVLSKIKYFQESHALEKQAKKLTATKASVPKRA